MKYLQALGFFLGTLGIYLVPVLVGWGIDDLGGFFSIYPRLGYAVLVAMLGLAAGYQAVDAPEGIRGGKGEEGKLIPPWPSVADQPAAESSDAESESEGDAATTETDAPAPAE